ncbi:MAG TPA: RidA family protein [Stellaceae bacterium]|nr:RidA family protein [Stellaceae bacterium]
MAGRIEARLKELKIELPKAARPQANYVPSTRAPFARGSNILFISGQLSQWNGEPRFIGKLGGAISKPDGKAAARICGLNILAHVKAALDGDLDRVKQCLRINGFVNSLPDFVEQPEIVNGCSDLMVEVLGDAGRHSRIAIGVASLPHGMAVEIDAIFEVE